MFEALTKRTRSDTVATKLTRVKDSALARRIWVDKVHMGLYGMVSMALNGYTFGCVRGGDTVEHKTLALANSSAIDMCLPVNVGARNIVCSNS